MTAFGGTDPEIVRVDREAVEDERGAVLAETEMRRCRSCQKPIVWAHTATGKRIPVDPRPVAGGNVRLTRATSGLLHATVDSQMRDLFDGDDDGIRYVAHFATCAYADEWRSR